MDSRPVNISLFIIHSYTLYGAHKIYQLLESKNIIHSHPDVPQILTLLTMLGVIFNIIYRFTKGFLSLKKRNYDILFTGYTAPSAGFIALLFWSMEMMMPGLVMTEEAKPYYSGVANHLLHTAPLIVNIIECLYVNHTNIIEFHELTHHTFTLCLFVTIWQYTIFHITSQWSYPFLSPLWDALPFGIGYWLFALGSTVLLRSITKFFFGLNLAYFPKRENNFVAIDKNGLKDQFKKKL